MPDSPQVIVAPRARSLAARPGGGTDGRTMRIAAVQERWREDPSEHRAALRAGIALAARAEAELVCLQELTLSAYFAADKPLGPPSEKAEILDSGPTYAFAREMAEEFGLHVHASLFERAGGPDELGYNTAIVVAPTGQIVARTRKVHIPVTTGYHEDLYFRPGPAEGDPFPVIDLGEAHLGFPTCWDQWFPELARAYSLAGAEVLVYPTAIGSEPEFPDFDTQPLWEHVIVGNGIANGTFMVAVNRFGVEGELEFYGSSFISDPYGRILVQAPRDEAAVLVADLDLGQRGDWLRAFPFLDTRRPEAYRSLVQAPSQAPAVSGN